MSNRLEMQLLRGDHWKALSKVKPHLVAKNAERPGPGPIGPLLALFEDVFDELEVFFHGCFLVALGSDYTPEHG